MPKVIINDVEFEDLSVEDIVNFSDEEIKDLAIDHPDKSGKRGFIIDNQSDLTIEQQAEYLAALVVRLGAATD